MRCWLVIAIGGRAFKSYLATVVMTLGLLSCYDKPKNAAPPYLERSCSEYWIKDGKKECNAYKFNSNPLDTVTKKATVMIETPRGHYMMWAFDEKVREVQRVNSRKRGSDACDLGFFVRTQESPDKELGPLGAIIVGDSATRDPGDLVTVTKLCGVLGKESPWIVATTKDQCPDLKSEQLWSCLSPQDAQSLHAYDADGSLAKEIFLEKQDLYIKPLRGR